MGFEGRKALREANACCFNAVALGVCVALGGAASGAASVLVPDAWRDRFLLPPEAAAFLTVTGVAVCAVLLLDFAAWRLKRRRQRRRPP
jgi:hypothetical protein